MERQDIYVRFADLRRLANTVPAYLAAKVDAEEKPTLRTTIEHDFQIGGLDTESLIIEFGKDYKVDLTQFDFTGFISPEPGAVADFWFLPLFFLFLLYLTAKFALAGIYWLFDKKQAATCFHTSISPAFLFQKSRFSTTDLLTTGDFVASAAAGRFVKRERVRFLLTRCA